jgi:beta-lactamase class D
MIRIRENGNSTTANGLRVLFCLHRLLRFSIPWLVCKPRLSRNDSILFKWDGKVRGWEKWDMDQTMKTAFQYLLRLVLPRIGAANRSTEKMQHWLNKVGLRKCTNRQQSSTNSGSTERLQISAIQQVLFLTRLEALQLPFSKAVQKNVHRLMLAEEGEGWKLYGKTGWGDHGNRQIGWYVGFVRSKGQSHIFALNMDIHEDEDAEYRKVLTRKILKAEGLMTSNE